MNVGHCQRWHEGIFPSASTSASQKRKAAAQRTEREERAAEWLGSQTEIVEAAAWALEAEVETPEREAELEEEMELEI